MTMNHVPEAPQSASGDYAWLGAEPGSVADQLYMSAADEWNQAINSRFVNELLDDTLPESILKSYLIQDFKFFNQGIMAHAIELAPRQETKDMLAKQSSALTSGLTADCTSLEIGNHEDKKDGIRDRKSTRLNSSHPSRSRMPSSA